MREQVDSIGEFCCDLIAQEVFHNCQNRDGKTYVLDEAMSVERCSFHFFAPTGRLEFWLMDCLPVGGTAAAMSIANPDTGENLSYRSYEKLSQPVLVRYIFFILQKIYEVIGPVENRLQGASIGVGEEWISLSDEELDEIDRELYGEYSSVLRREQRLTAHS